MRSIVELTPQDVQQKQFELVKRGFDPQHVGIFLDQVAATLAKRDRDLHEARTEIAAMERAVADVRQHEEAFRMTLNVAAETKDEIIRKASDQAEQMEAEARAAADLILERAKIDADDQATSLKREIMSLEGERTRLEEQVAELRAAAGEEPETDGEASGRRPLELVVDQPEPDQGTGPGGLAASVGDFRG